MSNVVMKKTTTAGRLEGKLDSTQPAVKPLFRGFIGGDSFITKKGYRGLKLESLWVQNIFEALKTDDAELATIALESPLADINDKVCGGICGAPFSIGDFGFYAQTQFEPQYKFLQEKIRLISQQAKLYLSGSEWELVEKRLLVMANHGNAAFMRTTVGDSFAALAIRQSAFQVAKVCMNAGIDPLVENAEGKDMFDVMKEQYRNLSIRLKETQDLKEEARHRIMVPSAVEHILSDECTLLDNFHFLSEFCDELMKNLETRIIDIGKDKILQRRAMLRNENFPEQKIWNIAQLEKAERYLPELIELKNYIVEKIHFHEIHAGQFESLSAMLVANYQLIKQRESDDSASVRSGTNSLETADFTSATGTVRGQPSRSRQGSVMSRVSTSTPSGRLQRDPSVISLKGEEEDGDDEEYMVPGGHRVGFMLDDTSVLTDEAAPSRIPKLPYIPNRLKNSSIDGKAALAKIRAKKKDPNEVKAGPEVRYAALRGESRESRLIRDASSPTPSTDSRSTTSRVPSLNALLLRPISSHKASSPVGPADNGSEMVVRQRMPSPIRANSSRVGFSDLTPRVSTAGSNGDQFGGDFSAPGTPSQKMRKSHSEKVVSSLTSTKELYAALGVGDEEDASSVGTQSRNGQSDDIKQNSKAPLSSAKLLAKSLKEQYAPVLGTLKQSQNAVIMYR